jgi:gamma-glutamylcyclotransferase (GGCT)/AIG2-like uncharacterized protein YtfP
MREYLFLYGTLIPSQVSDEMAEVIRPLQRIGSAYVRGRLYDLGEYPGAILDSSADTKVKGEVFEITNKQDVLASLDSYEEFNPADLEGSLFVRTESPVTLPDGRKLNCWVYVYNRNPGVAPLVVSGNYEKYKAA